MWILALLIAAVPALAETGHYVIRPSADSRVQLWVEKTGFLSGNKHQFVFDRYDGSLQYDPAKPEAWRAEAIFPALERWMTSGRRILKHCGGRDSWLTMAPDGDRGGWQLTERAM